MGDFDAAAASAAATFAAVFDSRLLLDVFVAGSTADGGDISGAVEDLYFALAFLACLEDDRATLAASSPP